MPIMNTNQILIGARRPGLLDTYVTSVYYKRPSITIAGSTITFADGIVEFDGTAFPLEGALNFASLAPLMPVIPPGETTVDACYNVYAVPRYGTPYGTAEPTTRQQAETAGLNYYFTEGGGGESYVNFFLPTASTQAVEQAGGLAYLEQAMSRGTASPMEIQIFNQYYEDYNYYSNPQLVGRDLVPTGTDFILAQVSDSPVIPNANIMSQMTKAEAQYFTASQGTVGARQQPTTYTVTGAGAGTLFSGPAPAGFSVPGQSYWLMKTIILYKDQASADANIDPVIISYPDDIADINEGITYATTPDDPLTHHVEGMGWSFPLVAKAWEYYAVSNLPPGQAGSRPQIERFLTRRNATILGRTNPVYLANEIEVPRLCLGIQRRAQLTDYACPLGIVRVCLTVTAGTPPTIALSSTYKEIFDSIAVS